LAIHHFKSTESSEQLGVVELRKAIKKQVKLEWINRYYRAEVAGEAVRNAFKTRTQIINKRKKGLPCDYKFQSMKQKKQSFVEQRLTRSFIERFYSSEEFAEESFGKTTTISYELGRWFVCTLIDIELSPSTENQGLKIVSIDPGVRTFATAFDGRNTVKYGDRFYGEKVFPLLLKLDNLISKKKLFHNDTCDHTTQFFSDTTKAISKKINALRNRIGDLISDLHRRVAYDLVTNHDVILLPHFETQNMVCKEKRKINTKTVRSMLGLAHYQFKKTMEWMCLKYGKVFISVNEAYTSKIMSWSGAVKENLGGSKTISDGLIRVDRDINGARNILLRALIAA